LVSERCAGNAHEQRGADGCDSDSRRHCLNLFHLTLLSFLSFDARERRCGLARTRDQLWFPGWPVAGGGRRATRCRARQPQDAAATGVSRVVVPAAVAVVATVVAGMLALRVVSALLTLAPAAIVPKEASPYGVSVVTVADPWSWLAAVTISTTLPATHRVVVVIAISGPSGTGA